MNKTKQSLFILCLFIGMHVNAQEFPLTPDIWEVTAAGHVFENFEGKRSLYLFQGRANLKTDLSFKTGVIEYDVYVTERRGFAGMHFRIADAQNFEEFYIRPHQSGNPDANQYTPVFNGLSGWQLYHGAGHAAAVMYKMNAWNHIKLVIADTDAEVYINDMESPLFYIPELKRTSIAGSIRLSGGGPSPFHFAELKVIKLDKPVLKSKRKPLPEIAENVIKTWEVSNSFPEREVEGKYELDLQFSSDLVWTEVKTESPGYANLARVAVRTNTNNTTFAKVTITSDKKQTKALLYGFSDSAKVYLNDQILAGGSDMFTSRDYRFLGTMGFHDVVYLPLKKGKNKLWIAVSENFGGWGIMAAFENKEGIKVD